MKLTTINGKFVLLNFDGQEDKLEKLHPESRKWIAEMIEKDFSWGGFFVKIPPVPLDSNPNLCYDEAVNGRRWGGSWELKAQWNKNKWKGMFKKNKNKNCH